MGIRGKNMSIDLHYGKDAHIHKQQHITISRIICQ